MSLTEGDFSSVAAATVTGTRHRFTVASETTAYARVRAVTGNIVSNWSEVVTATNRTVPSPGVPRGLRTSATGADSIEFSWNAVAGATGYEIQMSLTEGDFSSVAAATVTGTRHRFTVASETTAYARVRATGRNAVSDWSKTVTATNNTTPPTPAPCAEACTTGGRVLNYGFYSDFDPLSYGEDGEHRGYEADLVSALEAMEGAELRFDRKPIAVWPGIWLLPATPDYDLVGGGITILETRTRDDSGAEVVRFTSGHVAFRQSLLVRAADAARIAAYEDLDRSLKVGVLSGTTGEARLLQLTGLTDAAGVVVEGARITTASGEVVTDGTAAFTISSAFVSENLRERRTLYPPREDLPQVVFHPGDASVEAMLAALRDGATDAFARGEIGNRDAAAADPAFVVTALDESAELGGFVFAVDDTDLHACVDAKVNYLTDDRGLGYAEWRANATVFRERADAWVCGEGAPAP